jgi:hypothetical protein
LFSSYLNLCKHFYQGFAAKLTAFLLTSIMQMPERGCGHSSIELFAHRMGHHDIHFPFSMQRCLCLSQPKHARHFRRHPHRVGQQVKF